MTARLTTQTPCTGRTFARRRRILSNRPGLVMTAGMAELPKKTDNWLTYIPPAAKSRVFLVLDDTRRKANHPRASCIQPRIWPTVPVLAGLIVNQSPQYKFYLRLYPTHQVRKSFSGIATYLWDLRGQWLSPAARSMISLTTSAPRLRPTRPPSPHGSTSRC